MKILIHADGGSTIGLGHVMRCVAIAKQFIRQGHSAQIAVDSALGLVDILLAQGAEVLCCPASPSAVRQAAMDLEVDGLIIDSYRWTAEDFRAVKGNWTVVAFDDEALRELPVDAVINGAPAAADLNYQTASHTRLWLGPAYQIVRDDFRHLPSRVYFTEVKRVIALVGGDDPLRLLTNLARLLDTAASDNSFTADVICGPLAPMPVLSGLQHVTIHRNPPDLCDKMARADLAISASGQTLYELARCGTPTIAFCTGPDQIHNLAALAKANVVLNAGNAVAPDWARSIDVGINELVKSSARRASMAKAGQALIDGLGAERVVNALETLRHLPLSSSINLGVCN